MGLESVGKCSLIATERVHQDRNMKPPGEIPSWQKRVLQAGSEERLTLQLRQRGRAERGRAERGRQRRQGRPSEGW